MDAKIFKILFVFFPFFFCQMSLHCNFSIAYKYSAGRCALQIKIEKFDDFCTLTTYCCGHELIVCTAEPFNRLILIQLSRSDKKEREIASSEIEINGQCTHLQTISTYYSIFGERNFF